MELSTQFRLQNCMCMKKIAIPPNLSSYKNKQGLVFTFMETNIELRRMEGTETSTMFDKIQYGTVAVLVLAFSCLSWNF